MSKPPKIPLSLSEAGEFGQDYVEDHPESYSTKIFRSLAGNPLFPFRKNSAPSAKEKLIVATVVVAALDTKITELERDSAPYRRAQTILNAPLFKAAEAEAREGESEEPTDSNEVNWFQRYLTLRNVLSVLGVVVSAVAGVVAFWTADFRTRALDAEQRAAQTQVDVEFWKKQHDNYKSKADELNKEVGSRDEQIRTKSDELSSKEKELAGLKKTLEQVNATLSSAQATITIRDRTIQSLQDAAKQRTPTNPTPSVASNPSPAPSTAK